MVAVDKTPLVLVVEDEEAITIMLQYNLQNEGFEVLICHDGEEGLETALDKQPDIILLDWMLPSMAGVDVCANLRKHESTRATPVIMLTAKGEEEDRITGLDSGADDYMVKPFSPKELIARIRAVLRRSNAALTEEILQYSDITLDLSCHKLTIKGKLIDIGPTEFKLLRFFMAHPERVYNRDQLLDGVWGNESYIEERTVDVHIRRLRKTLNQGGSDMDSYIKTVRSVGYMLQDPSKA